MYCKVFVSICSFFGLNHSCKPTDILKSQFFKVSSSLWTSTQMGRGVSGSTSVGRLGTKGVSAAGIEG